MDNELDRWEIKEYAQRNGWIDGSVVFGKVTAIGSKEKIKEYIEKIFTGDSSDTYRFIFTNSDGEKMRSVGFENKEEVLSYFN